MEISSEKIWLKYQKELKRFALSKLKDNEAVNDILQEVFIKLHQHLSTIQEPDRILPWLYSVTRHAITDHFRAQKLTLNIRQIDLPDNNVPAPFTEKFSKCLLPLIEKLPLKYREAITLVELKSYSQLQLAKKLNISYSGAKSRVQRGRELLKKYLGNCCKVVADKYGNIVSYSPRGKKCACGLSA